MFLEQRHIKALKLLDDEKWQTIRQMMENAPPNTSMRAIQGVLIAMRNEGLVDSVGTGMTTATTKWRRTTEGTSKLERYPGSQGGSHTP